MSKKITKKCTFLILEQEVSSKMERTEEVVAIATSHRVLETMSSQFAITFPKEPVTNCDQFISFRIRQFKPIEYDGITRHSCVPKWNMCSIAIWGNISGRGEIAPLRKQLSQNLRQLVLRYYADFAYYFDCQFIFWLYDIILLHIP